MLAGKPLPRTAEPGPAAKPAASPAARAAGGVATALILAPLLVIVLAAVTAGDAAAILLGSAIFTLVAGLVIRRASASHPHARFGAANKLTLFRAAGTSALLGLSLAPGALSGAGGWVAATGAAALLALDGVDGWLARRTGLASEFGAAFDMEVDALLLLVLSILAFATGRAGAWVLGLGLMRYAFVALGRVSPRFARPLPRSTRRRAVCVVVIAVLSALLAPPLLPPVSAWLAAGALGLLAFSFASDLAFLFRTPG